MSSMIESRLLSDHVEFGCPECGKRYISDCTLNDEPVFQCTVCDTEFYLTSKAESRRLRSPGGSIRSEASACRSQDCPKCGQATDFASKECLHCGVVFSKFHLNGRSSLIEQQWQKVLQDYENEVRHQEFLNHCMQSKRLDGAAAKYDELLKLVPEDDIAMRMKRRIQVLASLELLNLKQTAKFPRWKAIKLGPFLLVALLLLGIGLFILGVQSLQFKNLAGLGAGIAFLSTGILVYLT